MQMKSKKRLRTKFIFSLNAITLILLLASTLISYLFTVKEYRQNRESEFHLAVVNAGKDTNIFFENFGNLVRTISSDMQHYSLAELHQNQQEIQNKLTRQADRYQGVVVSIYMGLADRLFIDSSAWIPPDDYDPTSRAWYVDALSAGDIVCTEPYVDADSKEMIVTLSQKLQTADGKTGVLALDVFITELVDFINQIAILDTTGDAFLLDHADHVVVHASPQYLPVIQTDEIRFSHYADIPQREIESVQRVDVNQTLITVGKIRDYDNVSQILATIDIPASNWTLGMTVPLSDLNKGLSRILGNTLLSLLVLIVLSVFVVTLITGRLLSPIYVIMEAARRLAAGDANVDVQVNTRDELEDLAQDFSAMARSTQEQIQTLQAMGAGNFSTQVTPKSREDLLSESINAVSHNMCQLVQTIRSSADEVSKGSLQVQDSSQALAQSTTQQAASIEEISSSLNQISDQTADNAQKAQKANDMSHDIHNSAREGTEKMKAMVQAVHNIDEATQNISKIIKVIDEIAFQTNILALNAAVEAARAGQHGKGFAVVAAEVRTLAAKSAQAAGDTHALIANSLSLADGGVDMASQTQQSLEDIVREINTVSNLINGISHAAREQTNAIHQINQAIEQVSQVIQNNSAGSEESASASITLSNQAEHLRSLMEQFQISSGPFLPRTNHNTPIL